MAGVSVQTAVPTDFDTTSASVFVPTSDGGVAKSGRPVALRFRLALNSNVVKNRQQPLGSDLSIAARPPTSRHEAAHRRLRAELFTLVVIVGVDPLVRGEEFNPADQP